MNRRIGPVGSVGSPDLRKWGAQTSDYMNIKGPVITTNRINDLFLEAPLLWAAQDVEILSILIDISSIANIFPWVESALTGIDGELIFSLRDHPKIRISESNVKKMKIDPGMCDAKSLVELNLILYDYCPKVTLKYPSILHPHVVGRYGFQLAPKLSVNIFYGCANEENNPALLRTLEPLRKLKEVTSIQKLQNL